MNRTSFGTIFFTAALLFSLFSGCASVAPTDGSAQRYAEIVGGYPQTEGPLRIPRLSVDTALFSPPSSGSPDVFIIVHPGYSVFFNNEKARQYAGARFRMLELQFMNESRFIAEQARSGNIVILIIPGNYRIDSVSPLSYLSYLNTFASAGQPVFYLLSETSSNGTIATNDMVNLYHLLQTMRASKVLIGGGYVGRCQKEFYSQFTSYYGLSQTYIVREISTISPEDVSEKTASLIVSGLQQQDFAAVGRFLAGKLGDEVKILSIPPRRGQFPPAPANHAGPAVP